MWVGDDELHVLGTVDTHGAPEHQQRLLVVVSRDRGFGELGVEQCPEVSSVWTELENTNTRTVLEDLDGMDIGGTEKNIYDMK